MKKYSFTPSSSVCCRQMEVIVDENGAIVDAAFMGGCNGNLKGVGSLIKGMSVSDVISRLEGIDCGGRGTSCPNELAKALKSIK